MIKVINYVLFLSVLLFCVLLCSSVNGDSNETNVEEIDSNSIDWLKPNDWSWVFPVFQLKNSRIPSRRYDRTLKCTGILVDRNAVLVPRLCINNDNSYAIATSLVMLGSSGREFLPYVKHRRLYPAIDYQSYSLASIEYTQKYDGAIIVKNDTVPGWDLLYFDLAIHYPSYVRTVDSPQFYQMYSKEINPDCVRISMISDAQRHIFTQRVPEKILPYVDFVERYKSVKQSSHNNETTQISWIDFDTFAPVFATEQPESSDSEALLGSALVCKGQNNTPVLTGVLINTSFDGLNIYSLVGSTHSWIEHESFEFRRRTERLTYSQSDPYETKYMYDLP